MLIRASFTPTSDMRGFFNFTLLVEDNEGGDGNRPGGDNDTASVKVVIITEGDQIVLTFNNAASEVDSRTDDIKRIFEDNFVGWIFNIDGSPVALEGTGQVRRAIFTRQIFFALIFPPPKDPNPVDLPLHRRGPLRADPELRRPRVSAMV